MLIIKNALEYDIVIWGQPNVAQGLHSVAQGLPKSDRH
jgi:hypothetical protein